MQGLSRVRALESLRARIESIEKRPPLTGDLAQNPAPKGVFALPGGLLHEVFTDAERDAAAGFGFALGLARGLLSARRPAVLVVQLVRDSQSLGVPYGAGLRTFGLDPAQIVLGRMENAVDLLWAIEEAIACSCVAAVIADVGHEVKALDFTASRRLSLRAAAGGSSVLLLRQGREREATAARMRWRVNPVPSGQMAFDARAPSLPRLSVELEKGRLRRRNEPLIQIVDWTENGFERVAASADQPDVRAVAAHPRAAPASLGNRLVQTG